MEKNKNENQRYIGNTHHFFKAKLFLLFFTNKSVIKQMYESYIRKHNVCS